MNYQKLLLFSTFIFNLTSICQTQNSNFIWVGEFGGYSPFDEQLYASSITSDLNGNIYTTGYFEGTCDFDPGPGEYILTSSAGMDVFICKFDASSNLLGVFQIGPLLYPHAPSIIFDGNGFLYLCGNAGQIDFDPGPEEFVVNAGGAFILKLDLNGNFIWVKHFSGLGDRIVKSIITDEQGNVYTTGWFENTVDFDPGNNVHNLTAGIENFPSSNPDVFIVKIDSLGNFLWAKKLGGSDDDVGNSIATDVNNNIYITGYFRSLDFITIPGQDTLESHGLADIFICKFDGLGTFKWAKQFGSNGNQIGYSIKSDELGNVFFTGGPSDVYISKLDTEGNFIWSRTLGAPLQLDRGYSISLDQNGNVYTTGYFRGSGDFNPGPANYYLCSQGWEDVFILKLDSMGDFVWAGQFGSIGHDFGFSIFADNEGFIYSVGAFQNTVDFDPSIDVANLTSTFNNNSFLLKLSTSDPGESPYTNPFYQDSDDDGYGNPNISSNLCSSQMGFVNNASDCNDTNSAIHPEANEICNEIDDNCNGLIDEGVTILFFEDADGDGYGGISSSVLTCIAPSGYVNNNSDCNDTNSGINPGASDFCNGIDDNCDGLIDEGPEGVFYTDYDGDGFGGPEISDITIEAPCTTPPCFVINNCDCNDNDSNVNPNAIEICNLFDDDCDGLADDTDPDIIDQVSFFEDADSDGYGNPVESIISCFQPPGFVNNDGDCDDLNENVHPGAEICNDLDDDCDGLVDDGLSCEIDDGDGDGVEDDLDNCPNTENPNQEDGDCDGVGNVCDLCPGGDDSVDSNSDGFPDCYYLPNYNDILSGWTCGNNKVYIAHGEGNGSCNTLCINYNAAQAHINHGDYLGPCGNSYCSQNFSSPGIYGQANEETHKVLELQPNPTSDELTIRLHGIGYASKFVVTDQFGRIVFEQLIINKDYVFTIDLTSANLYNGLYYARVHYKNGILFKPFIVIN